MHKTYHTTGLDVTYVPRLTMFRSIISCCNTLDVMQSQIQPSNQATKRLEMMWTKFEKERMGIFIKKRVINPFSTMLYFYFGLYYHLFESQSEIDSFHTSERHIQIFSKK